MTISASSKAFGRNGKILTAPAVRVFSTCPSQTEGADTTGRIDRPKSRAAARRRILLAVVATPLLLLALTRPAWAQIDLGMQYATTIGLPDADIRNMIGSLVRALLGFIGFMLVIQLMVAGFQYMTHGGNEEARDEAITSIKNAVIGLFIIMASTSIARFVVNAIIDATTTSYV